MNASEIIRSIEASQEALTSYFFSCSKMLESENNQVPMAYDPQYNEAFDETMLGAAVLELTYSTPTYGELGVADSAIRVASMSRDLEMRSTNRKEYYARAVEEIREEGEYQRSIKELTVAYLQGRSPIQRS